MKINEQGRSMIEMLGVLAIIGVLSVGGIAGYSKAMSKYRVNKTVDQVSHIAANTRILFGSQTSYGDLGTTTNTTIIDKAQLFPQEMKQTGANNSVTYSNPFQGSVTLVKSDRLKSGDDKAFLLTYNGIPQEACIDLATIDWGTGSGGGLVALGVNTSVGSKLTGACETGGTSATGDTAGTATVCGGSAVMAVDKAVAACSKVDDNVLYFKFY